MFKKSAIAFSILLAAAIMFSCDDRGTNIVKPGYDARNGFEAAHVTGGGHLVSYQLAFSMFPAIRISPKIDFWVYTPEHYDHFGKRPPYPVLYLLSPFRGSARHYFNHDLAAVADRMIAEGEIKPMLIVCIDGSAGYGGTFYGDTWAGGKYAEAIGDTMGSHTDGTIIDYIDGAFNTDDTLHVRANRAISGFGMGGYGALRIAITYSENFSSVSAVSAPLDFNGGGGSGGFVPIFKDIISDRISELSEIDYSVYDELPVTPTMPGHVQSLTPNIPVTIQTLDLLLSAAESVLDTVVVSIYDDFPDGPGVVPLGVDTMVINTLAATWFQFSFVPSINLTTGQEYYIAARVCDSTENIRWHYSEKDRYGFGEAWFCVGNYSLAPYQKRDFVFDHGEDIDCLSDKQYKAMDTAYNNPVRTMMMAAATAFSPHYDYDNPISYGFPPSAQDTIIFDDTLTYLNPERDIEFHLPFDTAGNLYDTVWTLWLNNNIESILNNHPGALDTTEVKLFTTSDDEYGFNQQTINFAGYLTTYLSNRGITKNLTPLDFGGYDGYPAVSNRFTYDILPAVLKFHSDNFTIEK